MGGILVLQKVETRVVVSVWISAGKRAVLKVGTKVVEKVEMKVV